MQSTDTPTADLGRESIYNQKGRGAGLGLPLSKGEEMPFPKWKIIFCWFDFWVGVFFDRIKRKLYVFPVPMIGLEITLSKKRCSIRMSITPYGYTEQCKLLEQHIGPCKFEGE